MKELDESLYDLLETIRKRPGFYIDEPSICRLRSFMVGYDCGVGRFGYHLKANPDFHKFNDWVARRLDYSSSTRGWCNMIREKSPSDSDAFHLFFVLLEEFKKDAV